jgi:hypothetical protein
MSSYHSNNFAARKDDSGVTRINNVQRFIVLFQEVCTLI